MTDIVKVVNETVNISETNIVKHGLYFELTEPISISGFKKDSQSIKLVWEENNVNLLTGFILYADIQNENEIIQAHQRAFRLTTLFSLKIGRFVFHKRPRKVVGEEIKNENVSFTTNSVLTKLINLDMTKNDIMDFIDNDSRINQQVAHFANGQKALDDANYAEAIKEFYQVIEYEHIPMLDRYKYLRHGVSHAELKYISTINELANNFGICCKINPNSNLTPKGKYVDITDPQVQIILEQEAKKLREHVIQYVDSRLNIQTN